MSFDKGNPKSTPAETFIAGKTAEEVVRQVATSERELGRPNAILDALVARYERKAAQRAEKVAAAE
jgi:hypothetical protein